MTVSRIALVGDFDAEKTAHRGIQRCFELAEASPPFALKPTWIGTETIGLYPEALFKEFQGFWCVPGSPYRNFDGALKAITWAREREIPFLCTCGGVQHALLEFARNVLKLKDAEHTEISQDTAFPLLNKMQCSLVEKSQEVIVVDGGEFRRYYGADSGDEMFHCSYGLNPKYEHLFEGTALRIAARAENGEVRAIELLGHPFFVGALFQPERNALAGSVHPLIRAFFAACTPGGGRSLNESFQHVA
jgi:CTP synthase (UTP-ammonia lyase)